MKETMRVQVIFAANADALNGSGHLKRCIEYANCLDRTQFSPTIYGGCDFQWLSKMASERNLKISKRFELNLQNILIVDSYDKVFVNEVIQTFGSVYPIQIADPYTPLHPSAQLIWFDPGAIPTELTKRVIASGTGYFPVCNFHSNVTPTPVAKNVLVSVGGSRQATKLGRLLDAIDADLYKETVFHVLGENEFESSFRNQFVFYPLGDSLGYLTRVCDTAITASGVSSWDFLSNGLRLGFFKFVENQSSNYSFLCENKLGIPVSVDGVTFDSESIRKLIADSEWRSKLTPMVSELFDFNWQQRFKELINSIAEAFK